jgi:hypothetical protein
LTEVVESWSELPSYRSKCGKPKKSGKPASGR